MKRFKMILAGVLVASVSSFAGMDLLVGGGLNMSNINLSGNYKLGDGETKSMRIGFNAGANLLIPFNEQMGILAGVNYETRGAKRKATEEVEVMGTTTIIEVTSTAAANYLQIPVLFSFKAIPALAINLGPELGFFLGGKGKVEGGGISLEADMEDVSAVDFGVSIGINYTIANMIVVGAGYYWGFLNTDGSEVPAGMTRDGSMTNSNIKINVGYLFHF